MKILKRRYQPMIIPDVAQAAANVPINNNFVIDEFMASRIVKDVINIGYTSDIIKEIAKRRFEEFGSINFITSDNILQEILKSDVRNINLFTN